MAGLSQVHQAGTTMVSVGVGGYSNKQAVAIGVSGMTENGKWTYRLNGAIGVNKGHKNHRGSLFWLNWVSILIYIFKTNWIYPVCFLLTISFKMFIINPI